MDAVHDKAGTMGQGIPIHLRDDGAPNPRGRGRREAYRRRLRSVALSLRKLIPASSKSVLEFTEAAEGDGAECFAAAERLHLEGIVSKRLFGSSYRSGRTDRW